MSQLNMKFSTLALLFALSGHLSPVQAQTTATVDQFLNSFISISRSKCSGGGAESLATTYEQQGRKAEAHSIRSGEKSICSCMPERVRWLQSTLSKEERARKLSEAEFTTKYLPEIAYKCGADQLKSTYGEGCADRFAKLRPNSDAYCSCMSRQLSEISDADLGQLASDSADYAPLAMEAKKRGAPPPERPPALKRFASLDSSCAKP
jgi:hypothetical protein